MDQSVNIFTSYAHSDEKMKYELERYLTPLKRSSKINIWSDRKITPGDVWREAIEKELQRADIILLLISADFLASEYTWEKEFSIALERHSSGVALVIPIILRPCKWQDTPLVKLQVLPKQGKPVSTFKNKDIVYTEIVSEIERIITSFTRKPKWLRVIEEEAAKSTGTLNLKGFDLKVIPDQVKEMGWLKELDLSFNQITKLDGFDKLTGLISCSLDSNQISKIERLDKLTSITRLRLNNNQISVIEGLDRLTSLNSLELSNNQISKIEGLDKLKGLKQLDLSKNNITKIEGLNKLIGLSNLDLAFCQITKVEGLDQQAALNELDLSNNQITVIEGLDQLTGLTIIYLNNNQIREMGGLDKLPDLKLLQLSSNQIAHIEGLNKLTALSKLYLVSNQITRIEGLEPFPKSLEELYLFGNPIQQIDLTVFGTSADHNCIYDLRNFFAETVEINVPEVKLILTGNSDVGKTKFRTYFTFGTYDTTRNSTHGLEVQAYKLEKKIKTKYGFGNDIKINVWDFGGQEYFHNTHQLFFNQNAVYIFLWERDTNKNTSIRTETKNDNKGNSISKAMEHFDSDYWLSNIRHFAPDATIIIVQNKVDKYEETAEPIEWLPYSCLKKYHCNNQYHISIERSSAKDLEYWYDFEKLKHTIFTVLKDFVSNNKEGNIYNQVRKEIEHLKSENYWKVEDFIYFIELQKSNSASAKATTIDNKLVIEHFTRQGKVLYPTNLPLEKGKVIFTNPQWLSHKIYEILDDTVLQQNGVFEMDMEKLVTQCKFESIEIVNQVIELMKQYNIIFFNPKNNKFVAPQYLPEVPKSDYTQVKRLLASPRLIIKVGGFLPKFVVNNIIARYSTRGDASDFYKYGIKTEEVNSDILLIDVDYPQKKIYVYTNAAEAIYLRNIFTDILLNFDIKLARDSGLETNITAGKNNPSSIIETQTVNNTNNKIYISIDDKIFVDWIALWNGYRNTDDPTQRDYCLTEDGNMVLKKMFAPYYLPYDEVRNIKTNAQARPSKLFISYSSKNTDFMRRFVTHLEPLKRNGTIELWYDRMIEPGTKWDETIKKEILNADVIIFLLSPDFIATSYIFEFEIPQAIQQMESDNSKLFFVELQPCSWNRTVLSRFQQTTDPTADNKGVIIIENAMNDGQWKAVIEQLEIKIVRK